MNWQLLVLPIVEKLLDAGVEYYKADNQSMGTVAATEVVAPANTGATILLAVEADRPTAVVNEVTLRAALEDMATRNGLKLTGVEISIEESAPNGT